jgi:hypothetical protein
MVQQLYKNGTSKEDHTFLSMELAPFPTPLLTKLSAKPIAATQRGEILEAKRGR